MKILPIAGAICMVVGWFGLVVKAYRESPTWGRACLLLPFVTIVYAILFWDDAKKPFFVILVGVIFVVAQNLIWPSA